jgi:hypothetical protein
LLQNVSIVTRIREIADHTAGTLQISKHGIIESIQHELDADPLDVWKWEGDCLVLKNLQDIPAIVRKTIKSIKQKKDGDVEVTFYDKQRAREQLMKYLGMLTERIDVHHTIDLGDKLAAAHARVIANRKHDATDIQDADFTEIDPETDNNS